MNGAELTRYSNPISRCVVVATLRFRSTDTTASESAMRPGSTPDASACTYWIAPPSGYVKCELYEALSGLVKFRRISSSSAYGKKRPIASTSSAARSVA